MTEEEFKALLGSTSGQSKPTSSAAEATPFASRIAGEAETPFARTVGSAAPVTDYNDPMAQAGAVARQDENAEFVKRNQISGIPINMDKEVSSWLKFRATALPTDEDRLKYLNAELRSANPDFYGADMPARLADTGDILVRVPDEQGKPMEIPINSPGFTGSDLGTIAAHAPATAAALAAALYSKKLPMGERFPKLAASIYSTGAAAVTGGAQDVAARAVSGIEPQIGEVAGRRGAEAGIGLTMDAGFTGAFTLSKKILSPFAVTKPGEIGHELRQGAEYYKQEFGMDFPMTAGEITQSPLVLRTEAAMGRLPGASATMEESKKAKKEFFETAQEKVLGAARADIPTEQEVGQRAVQALRGKLEPLQSSIKSQRENLFDALSVRLEKTMDEVTGEAQQVFTERVGAGVRAKAVSMWQSLQEEAGKKYEALYAMAGGSDRILQAPQAADAAKKALGALPGYEKGAATETFETVLPSKVISVLEELADTKGAQMSLRDLVGARSALDDVIAKERGGLPDVKLRELANARGLFTKAIEEAADSSPDKAMTKTWKSINEWYAKEAKRFDSATIQKLFVKADKPGHVMDEDIVKSLKSSEYLQLKEFMGADSPEFRVLKRSLVDQVMSASRQPGGRIDGKTFQKDFTELWRKNRAIFDDIFPRAQADKITGLSNVLTDLPQSVDPKKLADALTGTEGTIRQRLLKLSQAETKLAEKYRSDILKQIGEGKLDPASLDAGKFVDLVYSNSNVGPEHMTKLMAELSDTPEIQQALKQKVIEKLFFDAQRMVKSVDQSRLGIGEALRPANSSSLERAFGSEENRKKLAAILGPKSMNDIAQLGKLLKSEMTEQAFASAGGIAGGMFVTGMIRDGPISYAAEFLKQKFAAIMISSPVLKQYTQNLAVQKTPFKQIFSDEMAMTVIGSVPFQQALIREYGIPGAREVTQGYLRSIQQHGEQNPQSESPQQREKRFEQLLK